MGRQDGILLWCRHCMTVPKKGVDTRKCELRRMILASVVLKKAVWLWRSTRTVAGTPASSSRCSVENVSSLMLLREPNEFSLSSSCASNYFVHALPSVGSNTWLTCLKWLSWKGSALIFAPKLILLQVSF